MQERRLNAFSASNPSVIGDVIKLGIARDLERVLAGTLSSPMPDNLQRLVDRLEERISRRSHSVQRD